MTASAHATDQAAGHDRSEINRWGLGLFLLSEAFLFGVLLASRFVLAGTERPEAVSVPLGALLTVILLTSSATAHRAERAVRTGASREISRWSRITMLLGVVFLVIVGFEWSAGLAEFPPSGSIYGSLFFLITGTHALHLLIGVGMFGFVDLHARKGLLRPDRHWGLTASAWYWHYVDAIWLTVFVTLYLVG